MSTSELPPLFDHAATERELYARWQEAGVYTAHAERSRRAAGDRDPFTIVIPPPNVTAVLHMGHGLNNTVQDVLVRWRRMRGRPALWLPGTDHAGIATQNVVEKLLAKEGKTRFDLGRDAFVKRTEEFVEETGGQILNQLKAIGASADWSRTAYTLSPQLSRAVREAFVRLFERGLIYRGHRVIHWCPRCLTSLSDEEAEFHDSEGKLYHMRYPARRRPVAGPLTGRDHASRNAARRRRGGGQPHRRAVRGPHRAHGDAPDRRRRDPDHRRRLRRAGVRHRRGEDHAGPRRERLRGRASGMGSPCRSS